MPDEDQKPENVSKPRFGRRPRTDGTGAKKDDSASSAAASGAESQSQPKKAKVRIGPKSRRAAEAVEPAEAAKAPVAKAQSPAQAPTRRDREQRQRGPHSGRQRQDRRQGHGGNQQPNPQPNQGNPQAGQQLGLNLSDSAAGGIRRKRRRRKGRRPEEATSNPAPGGQDSFAPAPQMPASAPYIARQVLPPVEDDMDEVPSGIFLTSDLTDSSVDSDADSDSDSDSDFDELPSEGGDSQAHGGDTSMPDPSGFPAASSHPESRSSRERKRRKKRRERQELPPVDRNMGYWWAEQWVRSFEMLFPSNASRSRLAKGRTYARRGQVLELEVGPNGVLARVQGSRPRPYQVRLELNRLRRETWGRILHQLVGKATFLAQLLEGHLPPEIEEVFFSAGARLFPHGDVDVRARCNCPDPVMPCKHVAALNYALADALQRDPFLLFAMRGKGRDQFLQDLREMRGRDRMNTPLPPPDEDLMEFWRMGRLAESVLRPTGWSMGNDPARLLQSLGEPQLEGIREGLFLPMLEATYRQVAESMRRLPKDA